MIRTRNKIKAKEPIRLRTKALRNGNQSLYLDFYNNGKREYQFLKLYLIPERNAIDKDRNKQTLQTAEAMKATRIVEYQNGMHGFSNYGNKSKINLIDYVNQLIEKKKDNAGGAERGTHQTYHALAYHLKKYAGDKTIFKQIDKNFCNGFICYLRTAINNQNKKPLAENTQFGYMKKFETVINTAIADEITNINPFKLIKQENKPKKIDTEIGYLTIEEIQKLIDSECAYPDIRRGFLFSCFTGLRFSDVQNLRWNKFDKDHNGNTVLTYTQKKTKKPEDLPISADALKFLPPKETTTNNDDFVFHLPSGGYVNGILKTWIRATGITKRVTFHVSRHTNATLQLNQGTDIKTVSNLLGHSDVKATQKYAKVIDATKRNAVNRLNGIFGYIN